MQAIILAAGMGKRLADLTKNNTKCMVKVNNETLIERLLHILDKKQLSKIVIVIGYKGQQLKDYIETLRIQTEITYIENQIYDRTNNIYSLSLAEENLISDSTLLFESDIIFNETIVDKLITDSRENLAVVDKFESWMDGTCMTLDSNDNIVDFISGKNIRFSDIDNYYKTVNIYKFSKEFSEKTYIPFLKAYQKTMGHNEYYETVIRLIAMLGTNELKALRLDNDKWYEIDDTQDLDNAELIFTDNLYDKYNKLMSRYGGYWRYPKLKDFCYMTNSYYPSSRMLQEINANSADLISKYPSGQAVQTLLASRNFGIDKEHIVVCNGASEIINNIINILDIDNIGVIRPTFEEYVNRVKAKGGQIEIYDSSRNNLKYTVDNIIEYFTYKTISSLLLVNPDNPSGNYISKLDIIKLIQWAKECGIKLIIDDSFVDFVNNNENKEEELIEESTLKLYKGLYIIKSLSKSQGIPGLRLGILASSDTDTISKLKKDNTIWNINSYAEFYMQIYKKYEKDHIESLKKTVEDRQKLVEELREIEYITPLDSQTNYICCEVHNIKAIDLAVELLKHNILIKCATSKVNNSREYIRIAVKTQEYNQYLVKNLKEIETSMLHNNKI